MKWSEPQGPSTARGPSAGLRAPVRSAVALAALGVLSWQQPARAQAAAPPASKAPAVFSARLECQPRVDAGRVVCEVELEASELLVWSDAVVLSVPAFALPLRERIGLTAQVMSSPHRHRLRFALAARSIGVGALQVQGRGVVCREPGSEDAELRDCRALSVEAQATIRVGVRKSLPLP